MAVACTLHADVDDAERRVRLDLAQLRDADGGLGAAGGDAQDVRVVALLDVGEGDVELVNGLLGEVDDVLDEGPVVRGDGLEHVVRDAPAHDGRYRFLEIHGAGTGHAVCAGYI